MAKVIGIDLGTTRSSVACIDEITGRPHVLPNAEGDRLTPSVILFKKEGDKIKAIVGKIAKSSVVARPEDVAMLIKRHMCEEDWVFIDADEQEWRPETLSALILKKLKQDAERMLGEEVTEAVITVPYYFGNLERERTKQAGQIAGLEVLGILDEPIAAMYAYTLDRGMEPMTCCVYDFGGGTFDVSIVEVTPEGKIVVKATSGDRFLGGTDIDAELVRYFEEEFRKEHEVTLSDLRTHQDFLDKAENLKESLAFQEDSYVSLTSEGKVLDLQVTRETFEELISQYIDRTKDVLGDALIGFRAKREAEQEGLSDQDKEREVERIKAELENIREEDENDEGEWRKIREEEWARIDRVLLVGGSTKIPLVQKMIREETGKEPEVGFSPDEIVALGAAIQAAWKAEGKEKVRSRTGDIVEYKDTTMAVSHSLGIKAKEATTGKEINSKIIPKDINIDQDAVERKSTFVTERDYQTAAKIILLQGESEEPEYCRIVGSEEGYILEGIPPRPKGEVKIIVKVKYDRENIAHVDAWAIETDRKADDVTDEELKGAPKLEVEVDAKWLGEEEVEEEKDKVAGIIVA